MTKDNEERPPGGPVIRHQALVTQEYYAMIDPEQVEHVARLARLKLTPEELGLFTTQLSSILDYINKLNELDTADVEPLSHPLEMVNVFRDDERAESLPRDEALANAPEQRDGFFRVPPVLDWDAS